MKKVINKRLSEVQRDLWQDPDIRKRRLSGLLKCSKDKALQERKSKNMKELWKDPTYRSNKIKQQKEYMKRYRKGKTHVEIFGKDLAAEMSKANSEKRKGKTAWNKGLDITDPRVAKSAKARVDSGKSKHTEATKKRLSNIGLEKWSDPKYAERQIHAQASGRGHVSPTSYEEKIIYICDKYGFPFAFVGNWQLVIGTYCPDFIDTKDMGLLIETYCNYWHPPDYEAVRARYFREFDLETLFLSDDDLYVDDWESRCFDKMRSFVLAID